MFSFSEHLNRALIKFKLFKKLITYPVRCFYQHYYDVNTMNSVINTFLKGFVIIQMSVTPWIGLEGVGRLRVVT